MKLYCVRHGESVGNRDRIHQGPDTPLSEIGENQARFVAHRFKTIAVDQILTSPYKRAFQTATAIQELIHKPLSLLPEAHEIVKPTITQHKTYEDPLVKPYYDQYETHQHDPAWHYSDEENYFDLFKRTQLVLSMINKRPEKHLVLVSHGTFLTMFLTMMLYPKKPKINLFLRLHDFAHLKNTAITVYERNRHKNWRLLTLNDFAHLG